MKKILKRLSVTQLLTSKGCNHMELVLDIVPREVSPGLDIQVALNQMGPDKSPGDDDVSKVLPDLLGGNWR